MSKKAVVLTSKEDGMSLKAAKEIKLKSDAAVNVDAVFKHRNMVINK